MEQLTTIDLVGAWLSIFLTLCVLSFLYDDNPVYKLAEHLFLGISIGISVTETFWGVLLPNLINKLPGVGGTGLLNFMWLIVLAMAIMLLVKGLGFIPALRRRTWVARIPISFMIAAYAGVKLTGELNANLMTQVAQSIPSFEGSAWDVFSSVFLVVGLAACLMHFYFSAPQNRVLQWTSRFGILVLMLSFGASFGYTVMGRISLAIGRAQELLGLDKSAEQVAQINPRLATVIFAAIIIAFLVVWRKRQGGEATPMN